MHAMKSLCQIVKSSVKAVISMAASHAVGILLSAWATNNGWDGHLCHVMRWSDRKGSAQ